MANLGRFGWQAVLAPQVLVELWGVLTRPADKNGMGWTPREAAPQIDYLLANFPLLDEPQQLFRTWLRFARERNVSGVRVHDLRLAALMQLHGMTDLLTYNEKDFAGWPDLTVHHPAEFAL